MKTCMLNAYTDHVSEDDLRTLCEMQKQPSASSLKAKSNNGPQHHVGRDGNHSQIQYMVRFTAIDRHHMD